MFQHILIDLDKYGNGHTKISFEKQKEINHKIDQ